MLRRLIDAFVTKKTDVQVTAGTELSEAEIDRVSAAGTAENISELSEVGPLQLQKSMNAYSEAMQATSETLKHASSSTQNIIRGLK